MTVKKREEPAENDVSAGSGGFRSGTSGRVWPQALKLEPQPQVDLALGFKNLKPAPWSPST